MKIRTKLTLALSFILLILGVLLNLAIRQVLIGKMELSIKNSLKEIMSSTRESVKYRLAINKNEDTIKALAEESESIVKYIELNYSAKCRIRDVQGKVVQANIDNAFLDLIDKNNENVDIGEAIINIRYKGNTVYGVLSYPIHINGINVGILDIQKEYLDLYNENKDTIIFISLIEGFIFIVIFTLSFVMTTRITKPISTLTEAVKMLGNGEYNYSFKPKGSDEVAVLSDEFIKMRDKIIDQIETIKSEKEKVETLEKSRKQFFDNVTHEIKTPLTAITGYAEMIKENIVDDEEFKQKAISRIHDEGERLNELVMDLINVSKGLSLVEETFEKVEISSLIKDVADDMIIKAIKYNTDITCTIDNGVLLVQKNKIRELIINLIDNAIKYSIREEEIKVIGENTEKDYIIKIINKANPIPEHIYNTIFEPFVTTGNKKEKGSRGLGLYLCKEIVSNNKGTIEIKNGEQIEVKITFKKDTVS